MSNRKLIRPSLAEIKEQLTVRQPRNRRPAPNDQTNAENFYYVKQMQNKTPMVVVLQDGEPTKGALTCTGKTRTGKNRHRKRTSPSQRLQTTNRIRKTEKRYLNKPQPAVFLQAPI